MNKFSYYKGGIKKVTPSSDITVEKAIELIKGDTYKEAVEKLRNETDPHVKSVRKTGLDYFTFSGTFKKRDNDALIKHSGLICVDLDPYRKNKSKKPELVNPRLINEFEQVRADLQADPYTLCLFISPSGTGYKVVFKASHTEHLEVFHAIESLYKEKYNLILDKGVNDVSRACFVSYDPAAYYNEKAKSFKIINSPVAKATPSLEVKETYDSQDTEADPAHEVKKAPLSASEQITQAKNLQRAIYVVEQAESRNTDLTGDYTDWQLIAFSLATFGEDGRDLFHRVSQQYSDYDYDKAQDKFNDALQKGNFKTPAKFFSIAKDYGLEVKMPKTISEAKEEVVYRDLLDSDEQVDDLIKYGIYENGGTYWSMNDKGKKVEVSNFKMRIVYHVKTSDDEAYRLIQIKNIFGYDVVIKMNTDDFVSAGSFKKIIAREGNFIFKGADSDLCRLQDKLQREERKTELVKQLGYNKRYNFFAWANGIFDCHLNKFVAADELGIVEHYRLVDDEMQPLNFFIPAMASMFKDKEDLYVNDKRFVYIKSDVTFKDWANLYEKVYGHNGQLSLMFYIVALFSDIVFKAMGDRLPMLNVYGQKGTGKGTLIESLMKLYGHGQKQLMLGGASTVVGFMRKSGQYSNGLNWLDEYKNTLKPNFIESLKNLYDRIGYERGKKDNTFQTESTRIDSAIIVSGQEMPIVEEALFSRFILVITQKPIKSDAAARLFNELKDLEAGGLSALTVYLLKHRTYINEKYKEEFKAEQRTLSKLVNNQEVDDRFINNYACLIAMCSLMKEVETLPFNVADFRELCRKTLLEQFFVLRGSDSIGKWWSIVEMLFEQGMISEDRHFIIKDSKLYIRVQDVYQHYAEAMGKRKDVGVLDEATLKNYLENDPRCFISREKKFFGGGQRWSFVFKYKEIGINLIKAASHEEFKQKAKIMGVSFDDDNDDVIKQSTTQQMEIELIPNRDHLISGKVEINTKITTNSPF